MQIQSTDYQVIFGKQGYSFLSTLIKEKKYSKLILLTDDIVNEECLPHFLPFLETEVPFEIIEIESGEDQKNIDTCHQIWQILADFGVDRKALLINIGGGMITDLGGFVAATYKRGIDFVNIPTSLLAMVDASVGGKNAINIHQLKNMVGTFADPKLVIVDVDYLQTLPADQMRSGLAEMYKHGLIADASYWNQLKNLDQLTTDMLEELIYFSVYVKNEFVFADKNEKNVRKALNFGHTLGHAIEAYSHQNKGIKPLLHGEAIAIGMILEAFLSYKKGYLDWDAYKDIQNTLNLMFQTVAFSKNDIEICIDLLKHDKKNTQDQIQFVLLEKIGQYIIDQQVSESWIHEAFEAYLAIGD